MRTIGPSVAVTEHRQQANQFCQMYRRDPSGDWEAAFNRWADGKDFADRDRRAIQVEVEMELMADGTLNLPAA